MFRARSRSLLGLLFVIAGLGLAACGSDTERIGRGGEEELPAQFQEDPSTATPLVEALRKVPAGSVEATILTLHYYAKWGNVPSVVRLYDPQVRAAVGVADIAAVYSRNRARFASGEPRIVDKDRTREGTFLAVELRRPNAPPVQESYLLRRQKIGWGIVYDTFLDRGLAEYASIQIDGAGAKASVRGLRAALRASERFRNLFLPE